jgi:hypothetical protein
VQHAYPFQLAMMQGACVRTMAAQRTLWSAKAAVRAPEGIIVERPAQENVLFAKSNHLCGNISNMHYAEYCTYVAQWSADIEEHSARVAAMNLPPPCCLKPWAPEFTTLQRMIERERLSEDGYKDVYLRTHAHVDFVAYVELMLARGLCRAELPDLLIAPGEPTVIPLDHASYAESNAPHEQLEAFNERMLERFDRSKSICPQARLPIVLDWTHYGTWANITELVQATNLLQWNEEPGHVNIVFQPAQMTSSNLDLWEKAHGKTHVLRADSSKRVYFDLSWYTKRFKLDPTDKLLGAFRDMFFQARARQENVTLLVENQLFEHHFLLNVYQHPQAQ